MSIIERIDAMIAELEAIKKEISNNQAQLDFKPIMPKFKVGDEVYAKSIITVKDESFKAYKIPYGSKVNIVEINSKYREYRYVIEAEIKGKVIIDRYNMVHEGEIGIKDEYGIV